MRKIIIFILAVFLLILATVAFLYFKYESPKQQELARVNNNLNLSIYATDGKDLIQTGYKIMENNNTIKQGKTLLGGSILERIERNSTITILNYNLNGQSYYTRAIQVTNTTGVFRTNLDLLKGGVLTSNYYKSGDSIVINITSNGLFKNAGFCITWSIHIISAKTPFNKTDNEINKAKYQYCYDLNTSLEDSSFLIPLNLTYFGELDNRDYLDLLFYDKDCYLNNCLAYEEKRDLGAPNHNLIINNIYKL